MNDKPKESSVNITLNLKLNFYSVKNQNQSNQKRREGENNIYSLICQLAGGYQVSLHSKILGSKRGCGNSFVKKSKIAYM